MSVAEQDYVELLRLAAGTLTGHKRRVFVAEVTIRLCDGNARQSGVRDALCDFLKRRASRSGSRWPFEGGLSRRWPTGRCR